MVTKIDHVQNYYHVEGNMTLHQTYVSGDQYVGAEGMAGRASAPTATDEESPAGAETGAPVTGIVPECLLTAEAEAYWAKLRAAGFVAAEGYTLTEGVSNNQATYIADCMAARLGIRQKWKVFQQLWGIGNMAQLAGSWQQTGKLPPRAREIEGFFK